jgi:diguanylate cyclase (GGDEF)-like protein
VGGRGGTTPAGLSTAGRRAVAVVVMAAGVAAVTVLVLAPAGFGGAGTWGAVAVSAALLTAVPVRRDVGVERHDTNALEVGAVVAFAHLPPRGAVTALGAGVACGLIVIGWVRDRSARGVRRGQTVRTLAAFGAVAIGIATASAIVTGVGAATLDMRVSLAALAVVGGGGASTAAFVWLLARARGCRLRDQAQSFLVVLPVTVVAVAYGVVLAMLGGALDAVGAWLLVGTTLALGVGTVVSRMDLARRRLTGLLAAADRLRHTSSPQEVRDCVADLARRLLHARTAAIQPFPPTPQQLGITLPDVAEARNCYLVVGDRLGSNPAFTRDDADYLEALASIAAVALRNAMLTEELASRASKDPLTGLANRWLVVETFDRLAAAARRDGSAVAAVYVDVNRLKLVNDRLGHAAGDDLLCEVGERLRTVARGQDVVARIGGDEFLVLAAVPGPGAATDLANRYRIEFVDPFEAARDLPAGASVGVACWPRDADDLDGLLRAADQAMYQDKYAGRAVMAVAGHHAVTPS